MRKFAMSDHVKLFAQPSKRYSILAVQRFGGEKREMCKVDTNPEAIAEAAAWRNNGNAWIRDNLIARVKALQTKGMSLQEAKQTAAIEFATAGLGLNWRMSNE
jgi:hypothetical protein